MGVPSSKEARLFYRSAIRRFEDAQVLLSHDRNIGAIYLAGYGIECILKAVKRNGLTVRRRVEMLQLFRGGRAHDYGWSRELYLDQGGARFHSK